MVDFLTFLNPAAGIPDVIGETALSEYSEAQRFASRTPEPPTGSGLGANYRYIPGVGSFPTAGAFGGTFPPLQPGEVLTVDPYTRDQILVPDRETVAKIDAIRPPGPQPGIDIRDFPIVQAAQEGGVLGVLQSAFLGTPPGEVRESRPELKLPSANFLIVAGVVLILGVFFILKR